MASYELGCRMNNNVCSMFYRSYQIWRCKCVIDNKRNLVCMCNACNLFYINNIGIRISESLDKYSLCVILYCAFYLVIIKWVYKCCGNSAFCARFSIVYVIAAAPEATASAATPPSNAAILLSKTSSVGLVSLP